MGWGGVGWGGVLWCGEGRFLDFRDQNGHQACTGHCLFVFFISGLDPTLLFMWTLCIVIAPNCSTLLTYFVYWYSVGLKTGLLLLICLFNKEDGSQIKSFNRIALCVAIKIFKCVWRNLGSGDRNRQCM